MKHTKLIALGGVTAALSVVLMLAGSLIGIGTYAAPMLAGLALLPAGEKGGRKLHALLWLIVSILSLVLVPDVEASLLFLCPFGCYPLLRPMMENLPRGLRFAAKALFFLVSTLAAEAALLLFVPPEVMPVWMIALLIVLGCLMFVLYDRVMPRAQMILTQKLARMLRM